MLVNALRFVRFVYTTYTHFAYYLITYTDSELNVEDKTMTHPIRLSFLALIFLVFALTVFPDVSQAQEPVIAPEIGRIIAEEGVDAANERFAELMQSGSLDYMLENQGLMTLMSSYIQAGNNEAAEAVGEMYGQLMQQMMSGAAYPPGLAEAMAGAQEAEAVAKAQREANQEAEQQMQQKRQEKSRGKSRDDLERFVGLYSDPNSGDTRRSIFVTVSCDGYLVTGPMWADVGPWWMRSAADKVFTYSDSWTNLSFEFVGDGGRGTLLNHDIEGAASPLKNKAPLPDGWEDCQSRPLR